MGTIIYNAPANQEATDTSITDYGPKHLNARLTGSAAFTNDAPRGGGNCINFPDGTGAASTEGRVITPNSNFTAAFWLKLPTDTDGKIAALAIWGEAGLHDRTTIETQITTGAWHHIAAVKEGLIIRLYTDLQEAGTAECWGEELTAFAFTENNEEELAKAKIAGVIIYNYSLSKQQLRMAAATNTYLTYSIDGVNFKNYNVYVSDSDGLLDRPKQKTPVSLSWADEHGTFIDLDAPKLQDREITLKCFIYADDKLTFASKVAQFLQQFDKKGKHRLQVDIDETHPLVFDVYAPSVVNVDKRWNPGLMVGEFTLKLTEPAPVKKVIRFNRQDETALTITVKQRETAYNHLYTVAWGDGETEEFKDATATLTHDYSSNGVYYAVIAGDIDNITATEDEEERVTTNGVIIWEKI